MVIDIFLVGGGGSGAIYSGSYNSNAAGGGGGYTTTKTNVYLHTNSEYNITIASGGSTPIRTGINGSDGGTTSISSETATFENLSVAGGKGGKASSSGSATGGDGGSGGGSTTNQSTGISVQGGLGGIDGSGGQIIYTNSGSQASMTWYSTGQGTTTREFGEETYDLYATGGNGCWNKTKQEGGGGYSYTNKYAGTPNTGGGGAAGTDSVSVTPSINTAGGSGIVIIRNHKPISNLIPLSGNLTVGNTVTFDDKDWVVVHNDGNLYYLALSKIPENYRIISPGSNSNQKYVGSTIEAKVTEWETANLSALALQFCEDVTVENATHKVFLPTYTQVKTTFSHYAAAEANRICTVYVNNTDTAWDWWLSTPAGTYYWYQVTNVGKLNQYSNTGSAAIRPHICIRYDA